MNRPAPLQLARSWLLPANMRWQVAEGADSVVSLVAQIASLAVPESGSSLVVGLYDAALGGAGVSTHCPNRDVPQVRVAGEAW
jgi:hypothetical protein